MKTKMHCKSIFALLLAVVMVLSMIPATALTVRADDVPEDGVTYLLNTDFDGTESMGSPGASDKWGVTANKSEFTTVDEATVINLKGAQLYYGFSNAITSNYVIKFRYKLDGLTGAAEEQERYDFCVGVGGYDGGYQIKTQLVYDSRDGSTGDRIQVYDSTTTNNYYKVNNANVTGQWHEVEIHVNQTKQTYQLFGDGVQFKGADGTTDISFYKSHNKTSCINFPAPSNTSYNLYLDYFQIYTEDWTVNQQVSLGGKLGYTFSGNVSSLSGITGVRATLGDTTVDATLADGAYSVTVPVAASQMGETVTLEAMDGDTVKYRRTYTVEDYLNAVSATASYTDIANHTLNYGSAAATYFSGAAVTAPSLDLTDVPNPDTEGVDVTVTGTDGSGLYYKLPQQVTENYTLEFDYCVAKGSVGTVKIQSANGNWSGYEQVRLQITGDNDGGTHGDRFTPNGGNALIFGPDKAYGEWHTIKVEVDQTAKTCVFYLDNSETASASYIYYATKINSSNSPSYVQQIFFNGNIQVDNVKFTAGGTTVLLNEDFSDFTKATTETDGSWYLSGSGAVTYNTALVNPISGTCTGVTVNSANLLFEDQVKVRYKITLDDGESIDSYTVLVDGEAPAKVVSAGNNTYYVYSEGINPQMYGADVVLTVSNGNETVTVNYSPLDYIARMCQKDSTNADLKTLLKAMYNYYLVAKNFVTSAA